MSTDAPATPMTETKPCVRCRVQINAASGYCTLCGAVQQVRRRRTRWLITAGAAIALAGVAATAVALLGGSGAAGGESVYRGGGLVTLVPAGWVGGPAAAPPGVARATFADPVDNRRRLIVTAEPAVTLPALGRLLRVRALARSLGGGYRQHFFGRVFFGGGRPAWLLRYDAADSYRAVYVFSACKPSVAMTVELRAPSLADLLGPLGQIAGSAMPRRC